MKTSNQKRVARAQAALEAYNAAKNEDEPLADVMIDLLTDLMHYCHREKRDFQSRYRMACTHFETEKK